MHTGILRLRKPDFCTSHSTRAWWMGQNNPQSPATSMEKQAVPSPLLVWLKFMGIWENESFVLGEYLEDGGIGYFRDFYRQ